MNRFSILTVTGCVIVLLVGLTHAPVKGGPTAQPVQYVPLTPTPAAEPARRKRGLFGIFSKKSKRACVDVALIAGAVVTDERNVELFLRDGTRWRMRFKHACPALSYYQGYYYRRSQPSKLCAGRDAVIARSGGICPIDSLARDKRDPKD